VPATFSTDGCKQGAQPSKVQIERLACECECRERYALMTLFPTALVSSPSLAVAIN